mgnify:CR=1 FL=1
MKNTEKTGILYGIGVGPGDPELVTLKAVRIVGECDTVILPAKSKEDCIAYGIMKEACGKIAEKELICMPFPMTKDESRLTAAHEQICLEIKKLLDNGRQVAFLTIGDPTVYSTYQYIHKRVVKGGYEAHIVNGVPSFCAAAGALGISLADNKEEIHVIPASYEIGKTAEFSGTRIYMKSGKKLGELKQMLQKQQKDSENAAYDLEIAPIFENSVLEYERPVSYKLDRSLRRKAEGEATFNLKIKPTTKIGSYELKFKVTYRNNNEEKYSSEQSVYVKVTEEKMKTIITVDSAITNPEKVSAGGKFDFKFNINNIGDIDATEMYVKMGGLSQDGFMAVDGKDFFYVGALKAKTTYTADFSMFASKDIKKGNHSLTATVYYKNAEGEQVSEEKTLYILDVLSKNESDDETSGKPKIMIASYSTDKANIVAGDTINFTFKFINTSNDKSISNMKITLSSDDGAEQHE